MNFIETINEDGFKERWAIMDEDDPDEAQQVGIYMGVPDLSELDWEGLHKRVHNELHDRGVFTADDIRAKGGAVTSIVRSALVRQITKEYK